MALLKCKMCGGSLNVSDDQKICENVKRQIGRKYGSLEQEAYQDRNNGQKKAQHVTNSPL